MRKKISTSCFFSVKEFLDKIHVDRILWSPTWTEYPFFRLVGCIVRVFTFEISLKPFTTAVEEKLDKIFHSLPYRTLVTEALELCLKQHAISVYGNIE